MLWWEGREPPPNRTFYPPDETIQDTLARALRHESSVRRVRNDQQAATAGGQSGRREGIYGPKAGRPEGRPSNPKAGRSMDRGSGPQAGRLPAQRQGALATAAAGEVDVTRAHG
eukprot:364605-Chlamydomonas_euryale.AAC.11